MRKNRNRILVLIVLCTLSVCGWYLWSNRPQPIPPLDPATIETFASWLDEQVAEKYGPSVPDEYRRVMDLSVERTYIFSDPRYERINEFAAYSPGWNPDLDSLQLAYQDRFDELAELFAKGIAYQSYGEILENAHREPTWGEFAHKTGYVPNLLEIQTYARFRCRLAQKAASNGDWAHAFEQLDLAAQSGDSTRASFIIGMLISAAVRGSVYKAFEVFLGENVPLDVKREAILHLRELRKKDPGFNTLNFFTDKRHFLFLMLSDLTNPNYPDAHMAEVPLMTQVAVGMASHPEPFEVSAHQRYANFLLRQEEKRGFEKLCMKLSRNPKCYNFILGCAQQESFVQEWPLLSAEFWGEDSDPVTRLVACMPDYWLNSIEALIRTQKSAWSGYLVEAALAAQVYHAETGKWPSSQADLELGPPPELTNDPDAFIVARDFLGFGPDDDGEIRLSTIRAETPQTFRDATIHMGWFEPDDDVIATLRSQKLPMNELNGNFEWGRVWRQPDGSYCRINESAPHPWPSTAGMEWFDMHVYRGSFLSDYANSPIRVSALEQAMRAEPDLVESATAYWSFDYRKAPMDPEEFVTRVGEMVQAQMGNNEISISAKPEDLRGYSDTPSTNGLIRYESVSAATAGALTDAMDLYRWTREDRVINFPTGFMGREEPSSSTITSLELPPDKLHLADEPPSSQPNVPRHFLLDLKWKTPSRIFAVWNGGPDGDDDGGRIAYDPTNGTVSNGDLIQFVDY